MNAIHRMCEGWMFLFSTLHPIGIYTWILLARPFHARVECLCERVQQHTKNVFFLPLGSHACVWKQFTALVTDLTNYAEIYDGKWTACALWPRKQWAAWNLMKSRDSAVRRRFTRKNADVNCYDNRVIYIQNLAAQGLYIEEWKD